MMTIKRRNSRLVWLSCAVGAMAFGGCNGSESGEDFVVSTKLALTATTVSLQDGVNGYNGTTDTYIAQASPTSNYGTSTTLVADGDRPTRSGKDSSVLLRWDLSSIPAHATVTGVSLTFRITNATSGSYSVYALERAWVESGATWNSASASTSWQAAGAQGALDRDSTAIGTVAARSAGTFTLSLTSHGVSLVNGWVTDPKSNFGLVVANSSTSDGLAIASSEYRTSSYRPKITVSYTTEDGGGATGGASTGGASTGGTGGDGAEPFGFFVFSDSHVSSSSSSLQTALTQMRAIDSSPIGAFSVGDFTDGATSTQWDYHIQMVSPVFDPAATDFGPTPRYLGVVGNHDTMASSWYSTWTNHMTGQRTLGHSGTDGVYYSTTYQNVLFVGQDSEHVSGTTSSYMDAQTTQLASTLAGSSAQFKFVFFHRPVYSCNSTHSGFGAALPWLDLAETHDVDVVFTGHSHVYTRTCRMKRAQCTTDGSGTVHVETGTVGGSKRSVNVSTATVSGTDASGAPRSDTYECTSELMKATRSSTNDFCYVGIEGGRAMISCYAVGAGNTTPFDTWQIER